jgi:hypothetical protein
MLTAAKATSSSSITALPATLADCHGVSYPAMLTGVELHCMRMWCGVFVVSGVWLSWLTLADRWLLVWMGWDGMGGEKDVNSGIGIWYEYEDDFLFMGGTRI